MVSWYQPQPASPRLFARLILLRTRVDVDAFGRTLSAGLLRDGYCKHPIPQRRAGIIDIETFGYRDRALNASQCYLAHRVTTLVGITFFFRFGSYREFPLCNTDVDIFLIDAWNLNGYFQCVVRIPHIDARYRRICKRRSH